MESNQLYIHPVTLETPIRFVGLSLKDSGLPGSFNSLGRLWERFHREALDRVPDRVSPPVEVAVCTASDYIVGSQAADGAALPQGLAAFTVPPGAYLKAEFSAVDFSQLVDQALPGLWPQVEAWAGERGISFDTGAFHSVEVYPQETVALPRPRMYCLYPIRPIS